MWLLVCCIFISLADYGISLKCSHKPPPIDDVILGVNLRDSSSGNVIRKRSAADFDNLRIALHFDEPSLNALSTEKRNYVQTKLLPSAQDFWRTALQVRPVSVPIRLNRKCMSDRRYYIEGEEFCGDSACRNQTQCGEVIIPTEHLFSCRWCARDTQTSCRMDGTDGPGVLNADFVLYVSAVSTRRCADNDTVAYAAHCQQESVLDRPIAGHVNICPKAISVLPRDQEILVSTVRHEILHALGFSAGLFAFYRDDNGLPLTPRKGVSGRPIAYHESGTFYNWSDSTIRAIQRTDWLTRNGPIRRTVNMVVTPRVMAEARKHFNCSTLEGAELEDQGEEGTWLTHWEKRVFENEAMTGTHTQNPVYSRLTMALMEDTGWYKANYSMAQPLLWGRDLGCDFVLKSCGYWIATRQKAGLPVDPFCNHVKGRAGTSKDGLTFTKTTCSANRDAITLCNLVEYVGDLPPQYQNYVNVPQVDYSQTGHYGGSVQLADYCAYNQEFEWKPEKLKNADSSPDASLNVHLMNSTSALAMMSAKRDSRCEFDDNTPEAQSNAGLEEYGSQSKCFAQARYWVQRRCGIQRTFQHYGAGCYNYRCEQGRVWLELLNATKTYPCYAQQQPIAVYQIVDGWLHEGTILCPKCTDLCENCLPEQDAPYAIGDQRVPEPCGAVHCRLDCHLLVLITILLCAFMLRTSC